MTEIKKENKNMSNFPNLRFPGFEGEWEVRKLGEVCKMQAGKFVSASEINIISNSNLFPCYGGNGLRGYTKSFNQHGKYSLIGRQGALCGNVTLVNGKFHATEHAIVVTPDINIDTDWMFYLLTYLNLNQFATGMAQPGLSVQNLEKVEVIIPKSKAEQQKKGAFLSLIDKRIQTQNKIIEELESLIKETSKKLFSQQLRFKDENGSNFPDWKVKKLGEIGKTYNGLTSKTKENFGSGKQYIQYKQIFDQSKIDITKCGLVFIKDDENQNRVRKGDVFFTVSSETPSEIGMSSVLLDDIEEMYLNSFCFGFRPNSNEIFNISFTRFLFRSEIFRDEIIKLAQGSTRFNMSKVELMKLKISLPTIEEQIKIAKFLSQIDEKIQIEKQLLTQYENQKKYLLQNLFI